MKESIAFIFFVMAFSGGLSNFWDGFGEWLSRKLGCMRYTYEVTIWRHYEEEVRLHALTVERPLDDKMSADVHSYFKRVYPEYVPYTVMSFVLIKKRSIVLQTIWRWLHRACTRTANDALREYKIEKGLAV